MDKQAQKALLDRWMMLNIISFLTLLVGAIVAFFPRIPSMIGIIAFCIFMITGIPFTLHSRRQRVRKEKVPVFFKKRHRFSLFHWGH